MTADDGPHYAPTGYTWSFTGTARSRTHLTPIGSPTAVCGVGTPGTGQEALHTSEALHRVCRRCATLAGPVTLGCGCLLDMVLADGHEPGCDR